ncbi:MAG: hypothetical protein M3499_00280 [Actinomycetota bacterium]|nr:hypothetical protein [Actinomycetota bacterium]
MTGRAVRPVAFVDEGLGNSSYLIDLGDHRAALVIDPAREATPYLAAAERAGLSIAFTVETHLHADFLAGSRELAARGATVVAGRDSTGSCRWFAARSEAWRAGIE